LCAAGAGEVASAYDRGRRQDQAGAKAANPYDAVNAAESSNYQGGFFKK
jgi:hypothetical protein